MCGGLQFLGSITTIKKAVELAPSKGARMAKELVVSGAFHSPLMEPARVELAKAIDATPINTPICPIYQNASGLRVTDPAQIRQNLIDQLTAPVLWTQIIQHMIADGADNFVEIGPGNVLQGLIQKIGKDVTVSGA